MKTLEELIASRSKLLGEVKALEAGAKTDKGEKRDLTDDERNQIDGKLAEIETLNGQIAAKQADAARSKRIAEAEAADKAATSSRGRVTDPTNPSDAENRSMDLEVRDGFPMVGRASDAFGRDNADAYRAGAWVLGHVFGNPDWRQWCADHGVRALNGSSNVAGAILVPDPMQNAIIWNMNERGVFARYAQRVNMSSDTLLVPKSTGEVTIYAVSEDMASDVTASEPTFGSVEVIAKTWGALTRVSRNLADDAVIGIAEHVAQKIGYAEADKSDECGFNGTGASTYHGIQGITSIIAAGSVYTALTGNTAFGTLDLVDLEGMVGQLPGWANQDPAWYISRAGFFASMQRLMDAAGGNTVDNLQRGPSGLQFLGYPVRFTEVLNKTLSTQTSTIIALFGSLKQMSVLGTRKDMSIQTLTEKYATQNQIGILGFSRWGITNHEIGTASVAGAMIALKTPGS